MVDAKEEDFELVVLDDILSDGTLWEGQTAL